MIASDQRTEFAERQPPRRVTVLGSTGSIGVSTLDLIARNPDRFDTVALVANANWQRLAEQALAVRPDIAVLADETRHGALQSALAGSGIATAAGQSAVLEAVERPCDLVMAAVVGTAGLAPTLAALQRGRIVALANKECLVSAGRLFMDTARTRGAVVLPVDSEHNAIFQVLDDRPADKLDKIILTASGGPFRTWSLDDMAQASPEQALNHPNWTMGAKVTIDSATLMNKGLELIEAYHLFPVADSQLDVLIHRQSVVHGIVTFQDGSMLAQMGAADMRIPISYCLDWPRRLANGCHRLDLADIGRLDFEPPDLARFPALALAWQCLRAGQGASTVLNATNEVAVEAFLNGKIGFLEIAATIERILERAEASRLLCEPGSMEAVFELDRETRKLTESEIHGVAANVS